MMKFFSWTVKGVYSILIIGGTAIVIWSKVQAKPEPVDTGGWLLLAGLLIFMCAYMVRSTPEAEEGYDVGEN